MVVARLAMGVSTRARYGVVCSLRVLFQAEYEFAPTVRGGVNGRGVSQTEMVVGVRDGGDCDLHQEAMLAIY